MQATKSQVALHARCIDPETTDSFSTPKSDVGGEVDSPDRADDRICTSRQAGPPSGNGGPQLARSDQSADTPLRPDQGGERKKKWAPRARTGCVTCRNRRVKCDESQPACKKCALSNRECLWTTPRHKTALFLPALSKHEPHIPRQPSISVRPSQIPHRDHEVRLFHYFRSEVAPQLTGLFDQDFWTDNLSQTMQLRPILWYVCNAIAATHLLCRNGHCDTQARTTHQPSDVLPLQPYYQYQAALQSMRDLISLPFVTDTTKIDIILASQLLMILAMLRGDNAEMMSHYQNTCMLIGLWKTWAQTRIHRRLDKYTIQATDSVVYTCIRADSLFLFLQPPQYKYHSYWEGCTLRLRDDPFISLTEAYFEMEPIWNNVLKIAAHPGPEGPEFVQNGYQFIEHLIVFYKVRLTKWTRKLAALRRHCREEKDRIAFSVLDLRTRSVKLMLYYYELAVSNLCWDNCTAEFGRLVDDAKALIELRYSASKLADTVLAAAAIGARPGLAGRMISLSPMTNETLYLVARLCRDPIIRRRACSLLAHDYHLAPSVHTLVYMHLGAAQIRIEEAEWQMKQELGREGVASSTSSCDCSRESSYVCDGHRVYETALDQMTSTGAVLYLRTVDDYRSSRPWKSTPLYFTLQEKELKPLSDI